MASYVDLAAVQQTPTNNDIRAVVLAFNSLSWVDKRDKAVRKKGKRTVDRAVRLLVPEHDVLMFTEISKGALTYAKKTLKEVGFKCFSVKMDWHSTSPRRGHNLISWNCAVLTKVRSRTLDYISTQNGKATTFQFPCVELCRKKSNRVITVIGVHLTPRFLHKEMLESLRAFEFEVDTLILGDFNLQYCCKDLSKNIFGSNEFRGARVKYNKKKWVLDAVAALVPTVPDSQLQVNVVGLYLLRKKDRKAMHTDHPIVLRLAAKWGAFPNPKKKWIDVKIVKKVYKRQHGGAPKYAPDNGSHRFGMWTWGLKRVKVRSSGAHRGRAT